MAQDINSAISDAELLLAFIAEQGLSIEQDQALAVRKARDAATADALDADVEAAFWEAYSKLSNLIKPATVDGIKSTLPEYGSVGVVRRFVGWVFRTDPEKLERRKISDARAATYRTQAIFIVSLIALVLSQLYAVHGARVAQDYGNKRDRLEQIDIELYQLRNEANTYELPATDDPKVLLQAAAELEKVRIAADEKIFILTEEKGNIRHEVSALENLVKTWSERNVLLFVLTGNYDLDEAVAPAGPSGDESLAILSRPVAEAAMPGAQVTPDPEPNGDLPRLAESELAGAFFIRRIADSNIFLVETLLLPLLYGLLGGCAYVLRSLLTQIRSFTYTSHSDIRLRLRLYLGALAGMAIGWFVPQSGAEDLSRLIGPLALAFLAGYSVEVLFDAMDALLSAFRRQRSDGPSASAQ